MSNERATRAKYTLEFKQEAVRLVEGGQSIAAAARTLGVIEQTLFNWVKAQREGKLSGADSKPVSLIEAAKTVLPIPAPKPTPGASRMANARRCVSRPRSPAGSRAHIPDGYISPATPPFLPMRSARTHMAGPGA